MTMTQNQAVPIQVLQGQPGSVAPSQLFGMPGVTQWSYQRENLDQTATTLQQGSQVDTIFAGNFKQTDVVFAWDMEINWSPTYTAGTSTLTLSPQFPFNILGPFGLNFQNQFDTVNMPNGYIAALMQAVRPQKYGVLRKFIQQDPTTNAYGTTTNLSTATNYSTSSTLVKFTLNLLPSILFNLYYDLQEDGRLYAQKAQPIKAYVTPQLMSGTNRIVTPRVRWNPGFGGAVGAGVADGGPVTAGAGTGSYTGTSTLGFRRQGIYQPSNQNDMPPVFNWQYSRDFRRFSLSGVSSVDMPVPQVGQVLMILLSFWDPAANSGVGAFIPPANIKELDLTYGSGLFRFQDTPLQMQRRFLEQHDVVLPDGNFVWDMAITDDGLVTNAMAINTLTTSGVNVHVDFTGTQSTSAYCIMAFEALRFVSLV